MIDIIALTLCSILLGVTFTIWIYEGGVHQGFNVILYTILTVSWLFLVSEDIT